MKRLLPLWLVLLCAPLLQQAAAQTCPTADPSSPVNITPTNQRFPGGDPICSSGSSSYRFNDPPTGQTVYNDGYGNSITINITTTDCGEELTWTSTGNIVVEKVFAKGAQFQNIYDYSGSNPRPSSDGNIHCPTNDNGKYPEFSHIDFCFRYKLSVSKTALTSFTRTYNWSIDKSVNKDTWNFFCGDKGTSTYSIAVNNTGSTDANWAVSGVITVTNNTPFDAEITQISDVLSNGTAANVNCTVTFPYTLAKGQTVRCAYTASPGNGNNGTNTVTVTTNAEGNVLGGTGSANYAFVTPTTEVNKTVNISDNKFEPASPWSATVGETWPKTFTYTKEFTCTDPATSQSVCDNGGQYTFKNTATIDETGQSDEVTVTVNCYKIEVTKDAATSLTRTWEWEIDKTADQSALTLSTGQNFVVNYTVTVNAPKFTDSKWKVSGNISVKNPAPVDAVINSLSDVISTGINASVTCSVTFPYTLKAGETLTCTYTADMPDATARVNTATAVLQNYSTAADGTSSTSGTTSYTGTANVDFSTAAITKVDECADVSDNLEGALGTVCANDVPKIFEYAYTVGPYNTPGEYSVKNIAELTTGSGTKKDDSWTVTVTIPQTGCTLTQGYWKTHSKSGPAPYDDAWKNLGALEENTPFFKSGRTWIAVFRTPPAGNAFYNLAHQYMAAKLNVLNGAATTPAVATAISNAEALFNSLASNSVTLTSAQTRTARSLASTLDQYNNGLIGPGHCDDQSNGSNGTTTGSAVAPVADVVEQQQVIPQAAMGLKAWPNPTVAGFTIRFGTENLQAPVNVRVFDMNGKLVYATTGQANRNMNFGEGFAKGIYLVEVTQENQRQTMRLIKQ